MTALTVRLMSGGPPVTRNRPTSVESTMSAKFKSNNVIMYRFSVVGRLPSSKSIFVSGLKL